MRPLLVEKDSETWRLSGLATSQVTVELSPLRTLTGEAWQAIVGGFMGGGGGGGGSSGPSISSTWSPTIMSAIEVAIITVEVWGYTPKTTISPKVRRGSSFNRLEGKTVGSFWVSSAVLAL